MAVISRETSLRSRLADLLGVERGEGMPLTLMVTLNFVVSIAFVLVQTTASGLFVAEFGSHNLPYAYLSVAILASAVGFAYLRLSERVTFRAAQYVNLAFLALVCLVFWGGLGSAESHWFIFLLPFWFQALVNLANLIIWHSAGHLFNLRQAKRLFGLIGAGNWIANIAGGLVVASILELAGAPNLYLLAAIALGAAAFVLRPILGRLSSPASAAPSQPVQTGVKQPSPSSPFRYRYSRLVFAYILLWWLAFSVLDNIFFDRASVEYPAGAQLASFIGKQLSVIGVIAIITTSFLTSRIVSKYGVRTALLIMPLAVTASALMIVIGGAFGWSVLALFWLATLAKTLNVALGFSLSFAAGTLLYQPLQGGQRQATSTIAEGIVQPVAIGLAGLILLLFNTFLHFNAVGLSVLFLVIAAFWLWVILLLSREYPKVLSAALRTRSLGETTSLLFDPGALAQLRSGLQSPRAGVVLYALNQLEQLESRTWHTTLVDALPGLLGHPAPEVRREALRRVLSLHLDEARPLVRRRLDIESTPEVRSLLIQVLATLNAHDSRPQVVDALGSSNTIVRRGALIGSFASKDPYLMDRAAETLIQLSESSRGDDRALAAEVLGETIYPGATELLSRLLADHEIVVRNAAIVAAGHHDDTLLLERIVEACDDPMTAPAAESALISRGAAGLNVISAGLDPANEHAVPRRRNGSLIRVLGLIRDARAVDVLRSKINSADPDIRLQVLRSLTAQQYRAQADDRVPERVASELELAAWFAGAIQTLESAGDEPALRLLSKALESAFGEARTRVLLLLSFVYDETALLRAERAFNDTSGRRFAVAAEAVDAQLPAGLRPRIMPLVEDASYGRRLIQWQSVGLQVDAPALDALITTLVGSGFDRQFSVWLRMCAIHAAGLLNVTSAVPDLEALQSHPDPRLARTARWAVHRLSPARTSQGEHMLSLVEKVLILKSARLFSETPDNVLADIAGFMDEILVEPGEVVFKKGDSGDSLYIIVTGAVEVRDGDRLLNQLGEGDIFGELALLDPEPRLATVKAAEAAHLLRLDEASFKIILAERPEVSSAIIRVITRYLRSVLRRAGDVDPNLTPSPSTNPLLPAAGSVA